VGCLVSVCKWGALGLSVSGVSGVGLCVWGVWAVSVKVGCLGCVGVGSES